MNKPSTVATSAPDIQMLGRPTQTKSVSTTASPTPAFEQLKRAPVVPDAVLKRYNAYCAIDTRYRAGARLQQALWLKSQDIATEADDSPDGGSYLGSKLSAQAARAGKNFLSVDIHQLAIQEWMFCEHDAAIDPERLFSHSLSSMPLCFSLIGPMRLNPDLGTKVFRALFPNFVHTVERVIFEHAPSARNRESPLWLGDRSAVDFAVSTVSADGEPGIIYGEIKLTEGPTSAARMRGRYLEASQQVRLYRDPDSAVLRTPGIDQLWRYHMTAQLSVENKVTPRALFTTIAPELNRDMQTVIQTYEAELLDADQREPDRVAFVPLTLETFIRAIAHAGAHDLAQALWDRYCDFGPVVRLAMQEFADGNIPSSIPEQKADLPSKTPPSPRVAARPTKQPPRRGKVNTIPADAAHASDAAHQAVAS